MPITRKTSFCTSNNNSTGQQTQRMRAFASNPDLFSTTQVSANYSIMNNSTIAKEYGRFFKNDRRDTPEIVGFNMKTYEEELVKLRNDNFSLKLRIHLLEERQGLVMRPEDQDKENVFRVNIDLQVEKETLKQQIDDKSKLLQEAYEALEQMDLERQSEKSRLEEEILELRKTASQQNSRVNESPDNYIEPGAQELSKNSEKLLREAFGSINLGTHPETNDDKEEEQQHYMEEGQLTDPSNEELLVQKYEAIIDDLEKKLSIEQDNCKDLKRLEEEKMREVDALKADKEALNDHIQTIQGQIDLMNDEKKSLKEENEALNERYDEIRIEMGTELESKHIECVNLRQDYDQKESEVTSLCQKIDYLEQELKINKQESQLATEKVQGLNYELASLKARLDREKQDTGEAREQVKQVDDLRERLASKKQQLKAAEENQAKAELCISGLTQMNLEQKQAVESLEKDVKKRDKVIDILKAEHEKLKAKVRKYRSLTPREENQNMKDQYHGQEQSKSPSNISNKENISPINSSERNSNNAVLGNPEFHYLKEEVKLHQKEIELLKGELRVCKNVFMKTGASRAMEKVEKVYNDQISQVDHAHGKIVSIMRRRLEELADCIQKILGIQNGNSSALNASNLSTGDISALSDILNESRRLSRSFYTAPSLIPHNEIGGGDQNRSLCMQLNEGEISNLSGFNDPNETQLPTKILKFPLNEIMEGFNEEIDQEVRSGNCKLQSASPGTPRDINGRLKEYENLMADLKASTRQKIEAHNELMELKHQLTEHLQLHQESNAKLDEMQIKVNEYIGKMEQLQNEIIYWKSEATKQEHHDKDKLDELHKEVDQYMGQIDQLKTELIYWKTESKTKEHNESAILKIKLAECNNILEELRIKYGEAKERLRESMKENVALKTSKVKKKEAEKGLEQLCANFQDEIEELKRRLVDKTVEMETESQKQNEKLYTASNAYDGLKGNYEKAELALRECEDQLAKSRNEAIYIKNEAQTKLNDLSKTLNTEIQSLRNQLNDKNQEAVLLVEKTKSDVNDEVQVLKKQLQEAEAALIKYRTRQEKVDKKLRSELSKTHNVLKKTKTKLDQCKE